MHHSDASDESQMRATGTNTDDRSHHLLIVPPETEVAWTAINSAEALVAFGRCPFCDALASVRCRLDGILHSVLVCGTAGKLFSVVFGMPKRGSVGGLESLEETGHPKFTQPEVHAAGSMEYVAFPAYIIRTRCPFCDDPVQVVDVKGGDLGDVIKCESTEKAFSVYFPNPRDSVGAAGGDLITRA